MKEWKNLLEYNKDLTSLFLWDILLWFGMQTRFFKWSNYMLFPITTLQSPPGFVLIFPMLVLIQAFWKIIVRMFLHATWTGRKVYIFAGAMNNSTFSFVSVSQQHNFSLCHMLFLKKNHLMLLHCLTSSLADARFFCAWADKHICGTYQLVSCLWWPSFSTEFLWTT